MASATLMHSQSCGLPGQHFVVPMTVAGKGAGVIYSQFLARPSTEPRSLVTSKSAEKSGRGSKSQAAGTSLGNTLHPMSPSPPPPTKGHTENNKLEAFLGLKDYNVISVAVRAREALAAVGPESSRGPWCGEQSACQAAGGEGKQQRLSSKGCLVF